jgi:hypothetical protein
MSADERWDDMLAAAGVEEAYLLSRQEKPQCEREYLRHCLNAKFQLGSGLRFLVEM